MLTWDGLAVEDCFYGVGSNRSTPGWEVKKWRLTGSEDEPRYPIEYWQPLPGKPVRAVDMRKA